MIEMKLAGAHCPSREPLPAAIARAPPVTFREGSVVFHDLADLRILAEYHSGYLA
jgi:hypothetical protein